MGAGICQQDLVFAAPRRPQPTTFGRSNRTLITTLHQVDVATRFPRVLGMREGVLQFDLPSAQVSPQRLAALYAQYEHELHGPAAAAADDLTDGPRPAVMYCR